MEVAAHELQALERHTCRHIVQSMRGLSEPVTVVMLFMTWLMSCQAHHLLVHLLVSELIWHQVRLGSEAEWQCEALPCIELLHLIL